MVLGEESLRPLGEQNGLAISDYLPKAVWLVNLAKYLSCALCVIWYSLRNPHDGTEYGFGLTLW